jgi:thiol-disulfide isomerase/thioredoxin
MIVTLCFALWKLFIHNDKKTFAYKSGDHIARSIWQTMPDAKRTVVIAERAECGYCRASMPFYVKLVSAANDAGVEVVSVTSDDGVTHQHYLEANKIHMDRIIQLKDTPLKVSATPTLIVMDQRKTVLGAWVGELSLQDEDKVLHLIRSVSQ